MKKFFYFAAALVATVACTKTTVDEYPGEEIGFEVANYVPQTKAGNVKFTYDSFGVYAWYDPAEGTAHQTFMNNERVTDKGTATEAKWTASKTYYWPKTGSVDFIAYYPQSATPWIAITDNDAVTAAKITGTATTLAGTEDYMYADKAANFSANNNPATYTGVSTVAQGVPTLFHHALAKVTVKMNATTLGTNPNIWDVKVNEAWFDDMATSGTCVLTIASDGAAATTQEWTKPANDVWTGTNTADILAKAAGDLTLTTTAQTTLDAYTVLPQALAGKTFHIKYTVKTSNDNGSTWYSTETVTKTIKLDDTTNGFSGLADYWQMNKKITYTITINPVGDEIIFDPAVVDWDTVDAGTVAL